MRLPGNRLKYLAGAGMLAAACSSDVTLGPFTSDGCSLFPDRSLISRADWCSCCFEHDVAYWRGGTQAEREAADLVLRECIDAKTGNETLASVMYEGVRFGGSPYFYNWYRLGIWLELRSQVSGSEPDRDSTRRRSSRRVSCKRAECCLPCRVRYVP